MHHGLRSTAKRLFIAVALISVGIGSTPAPSAWAASASEIDRKVDAALKNLYDTTPGTKTLADQAKAILVFPETLKLGFLIGGEFGYGALRMQGQTMGYYSIAGGSFGLQAGLQAFATVLLFMDEDALNYFDRTGGWELGAAPSIVVVDRGMAGSLTTTTLHKGVFAFIFNQQGVMAGLGLEGTKITRIIPGP